MKSCKFARPNWFLRIYILVTVFSVALLTLTLWRAGAQAPFTDASGTAREGTYRLLLLGEDDASGLSDVIILATVDTETECACLMQIPRDTYFRYTDKDYKKINGAVGALGGAGALSKALGNALGLEIDSYIVLDLDCVRSAVDILGGVDIDIPCDMDYDDPAQQLSIHLKKGRQTLTGEQAAQFIRFRSGYLRADIGRMDAQKLFLAAFFEAAKRLDGGDLPQAAMLAMKSVRTDMSVTQMISLLRTAWSIAPEDITLLTLPGEEVQSEYSGAWYYVLSRAGTARVLEEHFGVTGAFSAIDPAHLFSDAARKDFESVYRREITPEYYTVGDLRTGGLAIG